MTLSKLAQLANVSVSVVSKAFSGKEGVSDAMREHVFSVAREHGCFQQFYHAPYDKPVVAVIIPEAISKFYIHYIETLKKSMETNGYTMLLSISNFDNQLADELIRYYTDHSKVDGLLLISSFNVLPQNSSTAIVLLGHNSKHGIGSCISRDLSVGVRACLARLKEKGHTRIGFVGEPFTLSKIVLFEEEMRRIGLEVRKEWIVNSLSRFEEAGRDGVRRILANDEKPTVIIGAYGYITQGILSELGNRGISVPRDMAVVSMDNDPVPLDPTLDVACIPSGIEEICDTAMRILGERIHSDNPNAPQCVELTTNFYEGETI